MAKTKPVVIRAMGRRMLKNKPREVQRGANHSGPAIHPMPMGQGSYLRADAGTAQGTKSREVRRGSVPSGQSIPPLVTSTAGKPITNIPIPMQFPFPSKRLPPRNTF